MYVSRSVRHNSHCFFDCIYRAKGFHYTTQRKHEWKRETCTYISIIFLEVRHTLFRSACQQLASTQEQITNLRDCSSLSYRITLVHFISHSNFEKKYFSLLVCIPYSNIARTIIIIHLMLSLLCRLLLVRLVDCTVNSSDFYSYRLIGKLTAFLQLQEFSQRNQTWGHRTSTFAARLSLVCWNRSVATSSPRRQLCVWT